MKFTCGLHRWNVKPARAIDLQRSLAERVIETPLAEFPRLVAGGDCAFDDEGREIIAAWVVWDRVNRVAVETQVVRKQVAFPYVPGLLSFREAPALLAAARKLRCDPGLFIVDGHGKAHPRRFGIACHLGVWLDRPVIGSAKTCLCGTYDTDAARKGRTVKLHHGGELVGSVVPPSAGRHPLYVSVGHRVTLSQATKIVRALRLAGRMTEPVRLADELVAACKGGRAE